MGTIRTMIVDDQQSIRHLLRSVVEELGAEVVAEAADGEEALKLFNEAHPHITLMDINMPRMDGVDALKRIIALDADAVVVMLTSQNSLDVVKECLAAGAKNFILKDNSPQVLAHEIRATWSEYIPEAQV